MSPSAIRIRIGPSLRMTPTVAQILQRVSRNIRTEHSEPSSRPWNVVTRISFREIVRFGRHGGIRPGMAAAFLISTRRMPVANLAVRILRNSGRFIGDQSTTAYPRTPEPRIRCRSKPSHPTSSHVVSSAAGPAPGPCSSMTFRHTVTAIGDVTTGTTLPKPEPRRKVRSEAEGLIMACPRGRSWTALAACMLAVKEAVCEARGLSLPPSWPS